MFHNIFQEKKTRISKKQLPKIIIDIHEKNSLIISELKYSNCVDLEIKHLEIGDYIIGNIAIERKTISDLVSSIISKRIIEQINNLQKYEKRLLIIEGNPLELNENIKINPKMIKGFILSCELNHNLPVIQTNNFKETVEILILLANQQIKNSTTTLHSKTAKTSEEQKQYIIESFPNIGPKKAKVLLEKFKTLENIFNAADEELNPILKNQTKEFKSILKN